VLSREIISKVWEQLSRIRYNPIYRKLGNCFYAGVYWIQTDEYDLALGEIVSGQRQECIYGGKPSFNHYNIPRAIQKTFIAGWVEYVNFIHVGSSSERCS
jgi:hypothetical protein